jgi:tetratricopeptide (TPR) repeat protein
VNQQQLNAKLKEAATNEDRIAILDSYAEQLFARENYLEAIKAYSQALKIAQQENGKAYFSGQIGICHYNAGNDNSAFRYLIKAAELFQPDKPEFMPDMCGFVLFHLGSLYEYHGKIAKSFEVRKACEKYIDSQEKDTRWMLYAGLGRNSEALGKYDAAIRYSQKAIQVLSDNDPGLSYLYETMANNYMGLKQYQEALKHYSRVLELDPSFERKDEVHAKMAECYRQLSNYAMAVETYEKILELKKLTAKSKDLVWLYLKMAECQFRMESFEKSLLLALETLHRNPRNPLEKAEAHSYLTDNYYEMGRYREAVEEGEKVVKMTVRFPNDDLFYVRMALSYHKLGDRKSFAKYRALFKKMFREDNWNKFLEKLA